MKRLLLTACAGLFALATAHAAELGKPAPAFKAKNVKGEDVSLADFKGKIVVLEWNNPECPFVKKHYGSGHMQKLQESYTGKGVVWLTVNSSAAGKQGHLDAATAAEKVAALGSKATAYLLDGDGAVGKAYGAKVTPHLFVINKDGTLVYDGAIDSIKSPKPEDIAKAENYVTKALDAVLAGQPVATAKTEPYGCGVKY
jgi:peroxiredoxin